MENTPIHIISLGGGVQSSAMAIMACNGLIKPMPECAIFADTGDEHPDTYQWIKELCTMLTFPVVWLKGPKLSDSIVNEWGHSQIPAWFKNGENRPSIGKRQCTKYFKILPVRHEIRRKYPDQNCVLWQGISLDETLRMKESGRKWLVHRWPLVELRKTRADCHEFLKRHTSVRVPKSACVYCPFRSPQQWRESQRTEAVMKTIRKVEAVIVPRGEFLTPQLKRIDECEFRSEEDLGQTDLFQNCCEGMCGV